MGVRDHLLHCWVGELHGVASQVDLPLSPGNLGQGAALCPARPRRGTASHRPHPTGTQAQPQRWGHCPFLKLPLPKGSACAGGAALEG